MTDTVESFSSMLRQALGNRIAPDAVSFLDMVAEDAVMEFPYAPPGLPKRLDGRIAIAGHLQTFGGLLDLASVSAPIVHEGAEPGFVVVEFEGHGHGIATGEPYEQRYVSLIRTRNGRIFHYRDYWNPLALIRALAGPDAMSSISLDWPSHE